MHLSQCPIVRQFLSYLSNEGNNKPWFFFITPFYFRDTKQIFNGQAIIKNLEGARFEPTTSCSKADIAYHWTTPTTSNYAC